MSDVMKIDVYYDFLCPYAHQTAVFLLNLKKRMGDDLEITWKAFSIEQVNSDKGPDWTIWGLPDNVKNFSRNQFIAAYAAERQGPEKFEKFLLSMFDARHKYDKVPGKNDAMTSCAKKAKLDLEQFKADMADPSLKARLEQDHVGGVEQHGVFGTPTIVFPNGAAIYVKMRPAAPKTQTLKVWKQIVAMSEQEYLSELKKAHRPAQNADH
jgi:predicted DsbA family dithiol-disulfide isomerase